MFSTYILILQQCTGSVSIVLYCVGDLTFFSDVIICKYPSMIIIQYRDVLKLKYKLNCYFNVIWLITV